MDYVSGYRRALEAAGAEVLAFEEFGSYQGRWVAKVRHGGEVKWISDYYGSCSGCDAFEAEFGWHAEDQADYQQRLAEFGDEYLEDAQTFEQVLKMFSDASDWDLDSEDAAEWVERNKS
jgi:hypothetical protein